MPLNKETKETKPEVCTSVLTKKNEIICHLVDGVAPADYTVKMKEND